MIYVALLRGINVGGNNKINMKELKVTFERVGMQSVVTYINTGNIIFADECHTKEELSALLEQAILEDFGLDIKVLILSLDDYARVMTALPEDWTNGDRMKSDVMFLWEEADKEAVVGELPHKPEVDSVIYVPGAILWSVDRDQVTLSGMNKLIGTKLYRQMTVRNVNTTRKIYELMLAANESQSNK